jgi:hypothetical protein
VKVKIRCALSWIHWLDMKRYKRLCKQTERSSFEHFHLSEINMGVCCSHYERKLVRPWIDFMEKQKQYE